MQTIATKSRAVFATGHEARGRAACKEAKEKFGSSWKLAM